MSDARALFALIEQLGDATIPRARLREGVGAAVEAAARAAGIVRDAPAATTMECPGMGCAREVRHGKRRILAVCTHDPPECETRAVRAEELAQIAVSVSGLVAALRRVFAIQAPRAAAAADDPIFLGEETQAGAPRDAFLVVHPARAHLESFLALRERAPRGTLVFVPTPAAVPPAIASRHAHVELAFLCDALTVRDGALVAAPRLRLVAPLAPPSPAPSAASLRARFPKYGSFADMHFRLADGHTLLVTIGKKSARVSYIDLGLAHASTREPLLGWKVLCAVCRGHGAWDWKAFGDMTTVPQLVSELQQTLMTAFDLTDKPFARFTRSKGYAPRFRASPGEGGETNGNDEGRWE